MGQKLLKDSVGLMTVTGSNTINIAQSIITVGGQQYSSSGNTTLNLASNGVNGLDTGSLGSVQIYYIHAIVSGTSLAFVASLSKTAPTGFSNFAWTGWIFTTNEGLAANRVENSTTWTWTNYNTTVLNDNSTRVSLAAFYRRIGDSLEALIEFQGYSGSGGSPITFTIPGSLTIDTSKLSVSSDYLSILGPANGFEITGISNDRALSGVHYFGSNLVYIMDSGTKGPEDYISGSSLSGIISNPSFLNLRFTIPIVGWSSHEL